MADAYVQLPDDSANLGKKADTDSLTVGANTVHRSRFVIADPATAAALAKVRNALPGLTDYAQAVRQAPSDAGWAVTHAPGAAAQASASKAAGGAGVKHIAKAISIVVTAGTAAPTAALVTVHLRDGATGAGSILATWVIGVEATAGRCSPPINISIPDGLPGTANTAMTLETSAATGANVAASVTLIGTSAS